MDPITHGLVGVALSAFSGSAVSMDNPLTMGAMLGAMSPDLDFVIRIFKDDAAYLEHHRGASHTIPFLIGFSVVITVLLSQMGLASFNFLTTLIWTFIGALSHTGLDILNSYGAKLFRKKYKVNILTLYDPVITLVGIFLIFNGENTPIQLFLSATFVTGYLYFRHRSRLHAVNYLRGIFERTYQKVEVFVMPSLKAFYKWDFVIHTATQDMVGQFNPWFYLFKNEACISIKQTLQTDDQVYMETFKASAVGIIFAEFSPNVHLTVIKDEENAQIILKATDLRYFFKENFLHHATLVLDENLNYVSSFLHPYKLNKMIPVYQ